MGVYFYDWGNASIGENLTDLGWISVWGPGLSSQIVEDAVNSQYGNNKVLSFFSTQGGRQAILSPDVPNNSTEFDVIARMWTIGSSTTYNSRLLVSVSGGVGTEDGVFAAHYSGERMGFVRYANGSAAVSGVSSVLVDYTIPVYLRFKYVGTMIYGKLGVNLSDVRDINNPIGDPPGGWHLSYNTGTLQPGGFAIGGQQTGYTGYIDWIGVGTQGDAAPVNPVASFISFTEASDIVSISASNDSAVQDTSEWTAWLEVTTDVYIPPANNSDWTAWLEVTTDPELIGTYIAFTEQNDTVSISASNDSPFLSSLWSEWLEVTTDETLGLIYIDFIENDDTVIIQALNEVPAGTVLPSPWTDRITVTTDSASGEVEITDSIGTISFTEGDDTIGGNKIRNLTVIKTITGNVIKTIFGIVRKTRI